MPNAVEVTDLVKAYGDNRAVDGVSFTVEEGEVVAILGPNGAGSRPPWRFWKATERAAAGR